MVSYSLTKVQYSQGDVLILAVMDNGLVLSMKQFMHFINEVS